MTNSVVGLEITEEEVRAAEVTTGKDPRILAYGTVRLPEGAAKDSEVLDQAAVVTALRELWNRAGFKSRRVVLGVVSRRVLVRDYRTQMMEPGLLKQALPFQVAELLPVPVDQAVIDFYPIEQIDDQLSGLLVVAVADTVTGMVDALSQAKLTVDRVDLSPFGLLRAIGMLTTSEESVAVVSLGPHTSYVVVAAQGVPRFVRIMPLELGRAVRQFEEEDPAGDGATSHEDGSPHPADDPAEVTPPSRGDESAESASLTQERIDDLVTQIVNTLRFHIERSGNQTIHRLLITGAAAGIPGVFTAFQDRLDMPAQLVGGHLLAKPKGSSRHGKEDLDLLTPVGLAMHGGR